MKKITSSFFDKIGYNPQSYNVKIGWYDNAKNRFVEVARFRNSYNKTSGANYGLLQIWSITFNFSASEMQGGYNACGNYDKPIANLEGCLYQLENALKNRELVCDAAIPHFSDCGSIDSLMNELKDFLQCQYIKTLFIINC